MTSVIQFFLCEVCGDWFDAARVRLQPQPDRPAAFYLAHQDEIESWHCGCVKVQSLKVGVSGPGSGVRGEKVGVSGPGSRVRGPIGRRESESQLPPSDRFDAPDLPAGVPVRDKAASALDFETTQNGRLLEFFRQPHNFNKWFKATFLEELSGATRMNNRAIWLRDQFIPAGLYLDNFMVSPGPGLAKSSHYRLCRIEDALGLSAAQKLKLIESKDY